MGIPPVLIQLCTELWYIKSDDVRYPRSAYSYRMVVLRPALAASHDYLPTAAPGPG